MADGQQSGDIAVRVC